MSEFTVQVETVTSSTPNTVNNKIKMMRVGHINYNTYKIVKM